MSKNRHINREAHYKNIIQKQKRIIQDLKKKVGRADKIEDRYSDLEEREAELLLEEIEEMPVVKKPKYGCPRCSGELDLIVDGSKVKIFRCQDCEYKGSKRI